MKILRQFTIILIITLVSEILYRLIPLPIPASIYGLIIMFMALKLNIIKLTWVKGVSRFLIEVMPVMFIPATVSIMVIWKEISNIMLKIILTSIITTIIIMIITGKVTQLVLERSEKNERNIN